MQGRADTAHVVAINEFEEKNMLRNLCYGLFGGFDEMDGIDIEGPKWKKRPSSSGRDGTPDVDSRKRTGVDSKSTGKRSGHGSWAGSQNGDNSLSSFTGGNSSEMSESAAMTHLEKKLVKLEQMLLDMVERNEAERLLDP